MIPANAPRSGADPFSKVFLPSRLLLGAGVALAGAGAIAGGLFVGLKVLLLGVLLLVIGVAVALSANAEGCAVCKKALQNTATSWPIEQEALLVRNVRTAQHMGLGQLIAQFNAPFPVTSAPLRAGILVSFCPQCENVARLQSCRIKLLPDGASTEHDISPPQPVTGSQVKQLLEAVGVRNAAWTKAMYGG